MFAVEGAQPSQCTASMHIEIEKSILLIGLYLWDNLKWRRRREIHKTIGCSEIIMRGVDENGKGAYMEGYKDK